MSLSRELAPRRSKTVQQWQRRNDRVPFILSSTKAVTFSAGDDVTAHAEVQR
jgi:hypothetical protein